MFPRSHLASPKHVCKINRVVMASFPLSGAQRKLPDDSAQGGRGIRIFFLRGADAVNHQINTFTTSLSFSVPRCAFSQTPGTYAPAKSTSCWLLRISFCTQATESALPVYASGLNRPNGDQKTPHFPLKTSNGFALANRKNSSGEKM